MNPSNPWDDALARVATKVNRHSFYTWFKPTSFLSQTGLVVSVRVPNEIFKDWLTKHYSAVISEAVAEVCAAGTSVTFVPDAPHESAASSAPETVQEAEPFAVAPGPGLNPRYTFDSFVVGPSNQFAEAACRAVAEAPSRSYNPLFVYGGVGLGKTHLMHAVGHYVLGQDPSVKLT